MFEYRIIAGVGRDHRGREIPASTREAALESIKAEAIKLFRGYTITIGEGGWVDDNNELVHEPCIVIHIFSDGPQTQNNRTDVLARFVSAALEQESVCLVKPGGRVLFIGCR